MPLPYPDYRRRRNDRVAEGDPARVAVRRQRGRLTAVGSLEEVFHQVNQELAFPESAVKAAAPGKRLSWLFTRKAP